MRLLATFLILIAPAAAAAQDFPALTGRVVDEAELLAPQAEAELSQRLEALEQATTRQLVVATVPDLQGYDIRDYGYQLGRHWGIGQGEANNGVILLVAPNERRVAIEVGYGLEPIVTDALASRITRERIVPRFKEDDYAGGILAGTEALIDQLQAPPEAAEQRALEAAAAERAEAEGGGSTFPLFFWMIVLFFVVIPMLRSGFGGRKYRRRRRGMGPVIIWGPGMGGGWGGGSRGGGFGGGGFSGGGGSFGGGGASGGW